MNIDLFLYIFFFFNAANAYINNILENQQNYTQTNQCSFGCKIDFVAQHSPVAENLFIVSSYKYCSSINGESFIFKNLISNLRHSIVFFKSNNFKLVY